MNLRFFWLAYVILLTGNLYSARAQQMESFGLSGDFHARFLPLDSIVRLATGNSPTLSYYDALIVRSLHHTTIARRSWQNNIFAFANYSTGDQRIITGSTNLPGDVVASNIASGYRTGVQINIPLFDLTSRKARVMAHMAEEEAAFHKKEEQQTDLVRQITQAYYLVLGAYESMFIRDEGRQAMQSFYASAEKEFVDGIISLGELSQIRNSQAQAEVYYQDARHLFFARLADLAVLSGVSVSELFVNP